jgi:arabinogalactan endo-1,4-beta-galactosidase
MYSYNKTVNVANTENATIMDQSSISNTFILGCDLEVYANAEKDAIFSGYNSTTDDIFIQLQFGGITSAIASVRFDFYALYDSLLVSENNTAYCKF